ncbi:double zinc ribbon domain-containing protein [Novosphingobium tardum]|uniref:Double zinc ribbon domain-containing protein n=1 Tax=Novosphingobium tardum TaxID=1538021 RepID=A0ABV8RSL3_9SPHN
MASPHLLTPLIDLVFPPRCPLCGDAVAEQGGLCAACWQTLPAPGEPACALCQRPMPDTVTPGEGAICAPCMKEPPRHDGIAAATLYAESSRKLVLALKHGRKLALATLLGRIMASRMPPLDGDWLVVPVPLHRWRIWRRGFNQSDLLAEHIARARGAVLAVDALQRHRATPSLGGLSRRERAVALKGAIVANARWRERLRGARVLLVDDVMTSGATTDACVTALRKIGVGQVRIACFARVIDEVLPPA